jgi:3-oxoacyl-[acyl-carrier protein] reductase
MPDLSGKIAVVTGGSRGIGRATALEIGRSGALVAVNYRNEDAAAADVVAAIKAAGGDAFAVKADLGSMEGIERLFSQLDETLTERTGGTGFDILVNNVGGGHESLIEDITEADYDRLLSLNLKAPFFIIQKAIPRLRAPGGRIVNVSSMRTRMAHPRACVYAPAKAGLEALTTLLAEHLGPRGITVNAVLPGATLTDANKRASDPVLAPKTAQTIALRRIGQPKDIADVIAFLASEEARWITGQRIDTSGGQRL